MHLDTLENVRQYYRLHSGFEAAFRFLKQSDLSALAPGRHDIDGENVFASVFHGKGRGANGSPLEAHRKYIDIQCVVRGVDTIGIRPLQACAEPRGGYDREKDIIFFSDEPENRISVPAGSFVIFYPEDAHAPLTGEGELMKVVVKVKV
jgi:YhcH/YjgK/YiaL family protein